MTIGWNRPLCEPCYQAWRLGKDMAPGQPSRVVGSDPEPCLVCGALTDIFTRVDPALAARHDHPRQEAL